MSNSNSNTAPSNEKYLPKDRDILLGSLFLYKKKLIAKQFNKIGIPLRWQPTKAKMRRAIESQIDSGRLDLDKIHAVLVELEGWGRQQIYLYKFIGGTTLRNHWLDYDWVKSSIQDSGMGELFNITRPITSSNRSPLYTIQYDQAERSLRFLWVQNRTKVTREELEDPPYPEFAPNRDSTALDRIILRAYRETLVRDVTSFDWDINTGEAMIMIRKLSGTKYKDERDKVLSDLKKIIPVADFRRLSISNLINNLRGIEDVVMPKVKLRSFSNATDVLSLASGAKNDLSSNPSFKNILQTHKEDFTGIDSFVRWKIRKNQHIGIDLKAVKEDDHRIAIRSQEMEEDVRLLLQRIRTHCA